MRSGGCHRALLVDDDKNICETLARIFETNGYEVCNAFSAEEALEKLAGWTPDIAILDVHLSGMNGVELARALLERCPRCGVLLFSGRPETAEIVEKAAKAG